MLRRPSRAYRIPLLRPLRPPNSLTRRTPQPRLFTQNSPLLLIAPRSSRPQLPYLSQPTARSRNGAFARLITTETRSYVREQAVLALKWSAICWAFLALGTVTYIGFLLEIDERQHPTPDDWTFVTRLRFRGARAHVREDEEKRGFIEWAIVGDLFKTCLERLEDETKDGKGLSDIIDGGIVIPDVGRAGLDISAKSWPWRAGYFEVIMGCAKAAEHLDGMVRDSTRNMVFPVEVMIGPSNPDPRPVPPWMKSAPLEENCVTPFAAPETYYMRILTGRGFTTKQKLEAADAYANWLEYKGLVDSASEMYQWGIDIAKAALPTEVSSSSIINDRNCITNTEASAQVTPNLLHATSAFAIHRARAGDVSTALPILLSVLRARRSAPVSTFLHSLHEEIETEDPRAKTDIGAFFYYIRKFFSTSSFPPPPPSGDRPVTRTSEESTCEESELMLYIGEILFATSASSGEGLGWTRQAVQMAETNVDMGLTSNDKSRLAQENRLRCKQCLLLGVQNWETMLRQVIARSAQREGGELKPSRSWFAPSKSSSGAPSAETLAQELKQAEQLRDRVIKEGIDEELLKARGGNRTGLWLGS
nr:hypothetical protein CFP56_69453 [Quercus suber]